MLLSSAAALFAVIASLAPALAAPGAALHSIQTVEGKKSGKYIVKLKQGVSREAFLAKLGEPVSDEWKTYHGFAGTSVAI